ncbi:putative arginine--tRNA ligase, mitochondrial [Holothuria leucospilota]|uniref:Probable arginine--tRNA ligase, mitochondrial n=1 Tax=Holothuria leucospilota TaxID=206669 RepID=A0A9Q0YUD6_HOLLE|nr:putative arginine--tRNA ligase, mitochondrial [Holothuria leucospilota]
MTNNLRQAIANQLSQITGLSEGIFLSLVKPSQVLPKKGYQPGLCLSLKSLHQELYGGSKHLPRNSLNDEIHKLGVDIAKQLTCIDHINNIAVDKNHLNFRVELTKISKDILGEIQEEDSKYGFQVKPWQSWKKQKIIVEYSSPNIAKPFHAGHLRSTLIGHFVANLCSQLGHDVVRLNYLGDWGLQFGLLAIGFQKFGSVKELSKDPIQHLFEVYVRINKAASQDPKVAEAARKFFLAIEQGDGDSLVVWKRFREFSIKEYISTYQRLGITFDAYHGESQYNEKSQELLQLLKESALLETSEEGTSTIDISEYLDSSPVVTMARSDGTSLYLTRDVAAAIDRHQQFGFHRMIYVVDKSQTEYMKQLASVLKKMNYKWANGIQHVQFGRVLGMHTRKGDVVLLKDILEEAKTRMLERMKNKSTTKDLDNPESVAECLGISALILQDLKSTLIADYKFDWDKVLESQGDTGVFLQYTHARLKSIERNAGFEVGDDVSADLLVEPEATQLLWHLTQFHEAVDSSFANMEPKHIVSYLLRLSRLTSRAAKSLKVQGSERKVAESRLLLFKSAQTVLANGMHVLGMKPLDKM